MNLLIFLTLANSLGHETKNFREIQQDYLQIAENFCLLLRGRGIKNKNIVQ